MGRTGPEAFLWGVATSAYQAEGGYNGPGEPRTNWADAESRGRVMPLGKSADFWNRYPEDFAASRDMGLNAFRLGIEWSRVQPSTAIEAISGGDPAFDVAALDRYAAMIAAARADGLEPIVTLHHFVHPAWLGTDPWLEPEIIDRFERYVLRAAGHVNARLVEHHGCPPIRHYITINEPNMLVLNTYLGNQFPGEGRRGFASIGRAYDLLLASHVRAYHALHQLHARHGWETPRVSLNNYCSDIYWSDKLLLDLLASRERGIGTADLHDSVVAQARRFESAFAAARLPLHRDLPFAVGSLFKRFTNWMGSRRFDGRAFPRLAAEFDRAPGTRVFDFVGLDYYDPFAAHMFRLPVLGDHEFRDRSFRSWVMNTVTSKWWDWRVLPRGLHFFCDYYSSDFGGRPVLIAENGMALRRKPDNRGMLHLRRDRMTRSDFLQLHVHEVVRIRQRGVPLIGYLHWSLFDNYEWGSFTPRFGLFALDYTCGTDRLVTSPGGDRPSETYKRLIEEARRKLAET